jgi:hypothetical protein
MFARMILLAIAIVDVFPNQKMTLTAMITINVPLKNVTLTLAVNINI